jgi:hypothetical protein
MRMLFAWLAVAAIAATAVAEEPKVQKFQRTKYQLLEQSMEALLDGGYAIVNMSAGTSGAGFLLRHDDASGAKWVVCSVKGGEQNGQVIAGSQCVAIN